MVDDALWQCPARQARSPFSQWVNESDGMERCPACGDLVDGGAITVLGYSPQPGRRAFECAFCGERVTVAEEFDVWKCDPEDAEAFYGDDGTIWHRKPPQPVRMQRFTCGDAAEKSKPARGEGG